eukprot:1092702-Prymnesium_polylepis.2
MTFASGHEAMDVSINMRRGAAGKGQRVLHQTSTRTHPDSPALPACARGVTSNRMAQEFGCMRPPARINRVQRGSDPESPVGVQFMHPSKLRAVRETRANMPERDEDS